MGRMATGEMSMADAVGAKEASTGVKGVRE